MAELAGVGVLAVLMVGCGAEGNIASAGEAQGQSGGDAGQDAGSRDSMPGLYVDQVVETLDGADGGNSARDSYLTTRDACADAGIPVQSLSESDVTKLGTTRLQRWITADSAAYRREHWGAGSAGSASREQMCQFVLVSSGVHLYVDGDRMVTMDLGTNEKREEAPKATLLQRGPSESLEDAMAAQAAEARASAVKAPVEASAAGQPCLQWQSVDDLGAFCVWSGGTRWGFSVKPGRLLDSHTRDLLSRIVLEQTPGRSNPTRVTTTEFRLGGSIDAQAMAPAPATGRPADKPL